ncbi:hypothetical protein LZ30DRAFT_733317, partial [Colletotrichum cereale]
MCPQQLLHHTSLTTIYEYLLTKMVFFKAVLIFATACSIQLAVAAPAPAPVPQLICSGISVSATDFCRFCASNCNNLGNRCCTPADTQPP